jgi:ABC-2 type transport system permease protein
MRGTGANMVQILGRLGGLIKKEFIHCYRDPVAMILILYQFTVCIFLCGYVWIFDAHHLNTVVYDMNRTATSRDLTQGFFSTEYFDLDRYATSMKEVSERLDSGKAKVALIIPPEFTRYLSEGRTAPLQFITDGSDANQAGQGFGFAKHIVTTYNQKIILERLNNRGIMTSRLPGMKNQVRTFFNQEMEGVYYVVIYHIVVAGLIAGLILSSTAIVREKERGTIDQLMITPTRPWELLVAKTVTPLMIGMIATVFSFLVVFWFNVPFRGNPLTFFAFMGFFLIGIIGIGILIGTICINMLQAILLSWAVWFPGVLITGMVTPLENMPPFMQKIAQFMPATHLNIAASGIFQKASGFAILWPQALKLVGLGIVFFSIGCFITWRQWK